MMLCGGSDAAIIPIGSLFFPNFFEEASLLQYVLRTFYLTGLGGFVACRALSQRNNDPTKASRPWDIVRIFFYFPV